MADTRTREATVRSKRENSRHPSFSTEVLKRSNEGCGHDNQRKAKDLANPSDSAVSDCEKGVMGSEIPPSSQRQEGSHDERASTPEDECFSHVPCDSSKGEDGQHQEEQNNGHKSERMQHCGLQRKAVGKSLSRVANEDGRGICTPVPVHSLQQRALNSPTRGLSALRPMSGAMLFPAKVQIPQRGVE